jgi:glycosyltransferase involved in cell wall biosynthesis
VRKAKSWIDRAGLRGEVIIVDNGSTDRSAEFATAAGARVVREEERGYGAALRRGFREARGRYMVMGDCDGTYDFSQLDPLVGPLEQGYDLVMGNRLSDQLAPGAMPWAHRFIGTPMISWVLRLFTGAKITDSQCGLRAMRRDAVQDLHLRSPGMEFASEMILKAMRKGLRITEVPISYDVRTGDSKLSTFRDGWRHFRFLLVSSPSYVFLGPGFLCIILGLLSLAVTAFTTNGINIGPADWEPVFASGIFLVVGVNALMLGLLAKLLAVRTGDVESRVVTFYHRYFGLERLLLISALMLIAGAAIDVFVLVEWLGDSTRNLIPWAAAAQALVVMSANIVLGGLAAAMIDYETSPA